MVTVGCLSKKRRSYTPLGVPLGKRRVVADGCGPHSIITPPHNFLKHFHSCRVPSARAQRDVYRLVLAWGSQEGRAKLIGGKNGGEYQQTTLTVGELDELLKRLSPGTTIDDLMLRGGGGSR